MLCHSCEYNYALHKVGLDGNLPLFSTIHANSEDRGEMATMIRLV